MSDRDSQLREEQKRLEVSERRSIRELLDWGLSYISTLGPGKSIYREIPREERDIFADLLGKILRYDPKELLTAAKIQEHEWFKL